MVAVPLATCGASSLGCSFPDPNAIFGVLSDASLLAEETELCSGGHHRSRYRADFERIAVALDDRRGLAVDVEPKLAAPERQVLDI